MYDIILFVHSWLRWIIILSLFIVLFKSTQGWLKNATYQKGDKIWGGILIGSIHLQLLIGLILYFSLSPIVRTAMSNMGFAMKNPALRYWAVEHFVSILIFATLIQFGRIFSKRANQDLKKHKRMAIFAWAGMLILVATLPWPLRKDIGRPLFADFPTHTQLIANPE
ncbi:hypothetical protein [Fluviispira multicolorata]|uniref:Cytochrome b561 n=1 Tax=Fluviispira multicolorata TaxID=2654512 RepID=A0A833JG29_9BACT|nr:hypothetical protein [Fluviispira multicolorata]KAB8031977.1 hypothetical protein GCL57_04845 [Fluviispira multicolorata]